MRKTVRTVAMVVATALALLSVQGAPEHPLGTGNRA